MSHKSSNAKNDVENALRAVWTAGSPADADHVSRAATMRKPTFVTRLFRTLQTKEASKWHTDEHDRPLMYGLQDGPGFDDIGFAAEEDVYPSGDRRSYRRASTLSKAKSVFPVVIIVALMVLGVLQLAEAIVGGTPLLFKSRARSTLDWRDVNSDATLQNDPYAATRGVIPRPCHSHNDYEHDNALFDALHYGCSSIEADIWLTRKDDKEDLYVGHTSLSLTASRTLRSLYLNPLLEFLDAVNSNNTSGNLNGVFETDPAKSLVLLIDIKNDGAGTFNALTNQLAPFRAKNYLTHHNGSALVPGPLTIVGSGSTPYSSILAQPPTNRFLFFDAPLSSLSQPTSNTQTFTDFNTTTSFYASSSLRDTLGLIPFALLPGDPLPSHLEKIRAATRAAHARGLLVRWWDTPGWPASWREKVWRILRREGADVLNVDDLRAARDWSGW